MTVEKGKRGRRGGKLLRDPESLKQYEGLTSARQSTVCECSTPAASNKGAHDDRRRYDLTALAGGSNGEGTILLLANGV